MLDDIVKIIEQKETIIIHRHERPDPDAIGSQCGLAEILKASYPFKKIKVVGEEEPSLAFLQKMDMIDDKTYENALVIVCDTANEERISDQRYHSGSCLIKIDHHPNNEPYGDVMWVDTTYSSTSEMIYELYLTGKKHGWKLNEKAALLLYAGIVGDTGRFLYPNTTERTHRYTSELIKERFDRAQFYSTLYKRNLHITRLEGYVLQHFEILQDGLGVMNLTKEVLASYNVTTSESSALVNAFSDVDGLKAWLFFVEEEDGSSIRVRLRSKGPVINEIAQKYNGGGHPLASGAKVNSWGETKLIISDLLEVCKEETKSKE